MRLIDADVHVRWETDDELKPYLPETWWERWSHAFGHSEPGVRIKPKYYDPGTWPVYRHGVCTVNTEAVANAAELAAGWLEPQGIEAAVVSVYDAPLIATFGDVVYPLAVAEAINRWLVDAYLEKDTRLWGSITVATQDAEVAAREVRRAAEHPRMVQVVLPAGTRLPYGHRYYRPIFRAAAECGLAVAFASGTEGMGTSNTPTPVGWPGTTAEMRVTPATNFLCHITSLITEGVFTEFPELRIAGYELGAGWLPPYLWRFDKNFKALRSECPWVTELPSEVVAKHFRFSSAGVIPEGAPAEEFWRLMGSLPGPGLLMYGSNHPRWDVETPEESAVLRTCATEAQRERVAFGAALEVFPRMNRTWAAQGLVGRG